MRLILFFFRWIFKAPKKASPIVISVKRPSRIRPRIAPNDLRRAKVRIIVDGDTVLVAEGANRIKIRLDGIDCPEDGQPWGDIAKAGLIKMIGGKEVYLESYGVDCYDRTLATLYVMTKRGLINVNERMITLGHAWVMRRHYRHLPPQRQYQLNSLEEWARSRRVGLWKTHEPIPPWEWRGRKKIRVGA